MNRRTSILAIVGAGLAARRAAAEASAPPWRITVHHTATPADRPGERVASIRDYHVRERGWQDVGYHFLVGEDGSIWPGRSLALPGAHVAGQNERNLGIAFIGDYVAGPTREPPPAALHAARRLLEILVRAYGVSRYRVLFHRDLAATECPGAWPKALLFGAETGARKPEGEAKG
jgi:hypothetical protein